MPIDVAQAVGHELAPMPFSYEERDVMLYALGVGLGGSPTDPGTLQYTFENDLKVLPTFGVIPAFPALMQIGNVPGLEFNPMLLLHGEQYTELKAPIPTSGTLTTKARISAIYDKGKGALVLIDADTVDGKDAVVCSNQFSIFLRGEGGFGGESGPKPTHEAPERAPDAVEEFQTLPQQALIYRLSGDRNPLHADPNFAAMGGFDRPILHGLCTYGIVGHAVLKTYCDYDPAAFKSIKARFSGHVFPGETIVTKMWKDGSTITLQADVKERGTTCISNAAVQLNA